MWREPEDSAAWRKGCHSRLEILHCSHLRFSSQKNGFILEACHTCTESLTVSLVRNVNNSTHKKADL